MFVLDRFLCAHDLLLFVCLFDEVNLCICLQTMLIHARIQQTLKKAEFEKCADYIIFFYACKLRLKFHVNYFYDLKFYKNRLLETIRMAFQTIFSLIFQLLILLQAC